MICGAINYCYGVNNEDATARNNNSMHYSLVINEQNEIALVISKASENFAVWTGAMFSDYAYHLIDNGKQWNTTPSTGGISGIFYHGSAQKPIILPIPGSTLEEKLGTNLLLGVKYDFYATTLKEEKTNTLRFILDATEVVSAENKGKTIDQFNLKVNITSKENVKWIKITVNNITDKAVNWNEGHILEMFYFTIEQSPKGGGAWNYQTFGNHNKSLLTPRIVRPKETIFYEIKLDELLKQANITLQRSNHIGASNIPGSDLPHTYQPAYRLGVSTKPPERKPNRFADYAKLEFLVLLKECK